jgi:hypothetical protein
MMLPDRQARSSFSRGCRVPVMKPPMKMDRNAIRTLRGRVRSKSPVRFESVNGNLWED